MFSRQQLLGLREVYINSHVASSAGENDQACKRKDVRMTLHLPIRNIMTKFHSMHTQSLWGISRIIFCLFGGRITREAEKKCKLKAEIPSG